MKHAMGLYTVCSLLSHSTVACVSLLNLYYSTFLLFSVCAAVYVNDEPLMPGEHYIYSDGHHKKNFTVYYGKMVPGEAIVVRLFSL